MSKNVAHTAEGDPPEAPRELHAIRAKLAAGARLTAADGLLLYACPDLLAVGLLADWVARRRHGRRVFYVRNGHLNYSNYCILCCPFCSFSRRKGRDTRPGGYEMSLEEIFAAVATMVARGIRELHVVGGLHPEWPFERYIQMLRGLRARHLRLGLKCFTATEVRHLARLAGLPVRETLQALREAGLDALPGGGAEILDDEVRARICPQKERSAEWLTVHREAHRLGIPSNATMLHGHCETPAQRVAHLLKLRELQDQTGGFLAFVPLPYHPANNALGVVAPASCRQRKPAGRRRYIEHGPSAPAVLREHAVARLLLDNFPHVKAYWIAAGVGVAQLALHFGASDLDGKVLHETLFHHAGARTPPALEVEELKRLIREAGREPVERDALYRRVAGR